MELGGDTVILVNNLRELFNFLTFPPKFVYSPYEVRRCFSKLTCASVCLSDVTLFRNFYLCTYLLEVKYK